MPTLGGDSMRPEIQAGLRTDDSTLENWVMSCRVFGRQLEFEAMNVAVEAARRLGAKAFIADYITTLKNHAISALYPSLGFAAFKPSATRWFLKLEDYVA